jgi:hypothetical protein
VRRTATVALRKCSTCNSNGLACGSAESPRPGPIAGSDLRWRWPAQLVTSAGENGLSISARRLTLLCALHESGSGRYCCKSPKLPAANFSAVKKSDQRPPVDVASITLPRSPASLSSGDEVPHIFTRKSRVQPKEILITSAKRLLQQNRHIADHSQCGGMSAAGGS